LPRPAKGGRATGCGGRERKRARRAGGLLPFATRRPTAEANRFEAGIGDGNWSVVKPTQLSKPALKIFRLTFGRPESGLPGRAESRFHLKSVPRRRNDSPCRGADECPTGYLGWRGRRCNGLQQEVARSLQFAAQRHVRLGDTDHIRYGAQAVRQESESPAAYSGRRGTARRHDATTGARQHDFLLQAPEVLFPRNCADRERSVLYTLQIDNATANIAITKSGPFPTRRRPGASRESIPSWSTT